MTDSAVPKPRFDKTINYGHILTAFTICVSLLGTGVYQVQQNTQMRYQLAQIQSSVDAYGPRIGSLEASNQLNSERITNAAASMRSMREDFNTTSNDLRRVDGQLQNEIQTTKIDIAGIRAGMDRSN